MSHTRYRLHYAAQQNLQMQPDAADSEEDQTNSWVVLLRMKTSWKCWYWVSQVSIGNGTLILQIFLSYDVPVIQRIASCYKNRMNTRVITLWWVDATSLTTSVSTMRFLAEIMLILWAIKSHLKSHMINSLTLVESFHMKFTTLAEEEEVVKLTTLWTTGPRSFGRTYVAFVGGLVVHLFSE